MGRPKGSLNKATLKARAAAARQLHITTQIERERIAEIVQNREIARDVLRRLMEVCEGAAGQHRTVINAEGQTVNEAAWQRFHDWIKLTADIAKAVMKTETPQLAAVVVAAPAPTIEGNAEEEFTIRIFETPPAMLEHHKA